MKRIEIIAKMDEMDVAKEIIEFLVKHKLYYSELDAVYGLAQYLREEVGDTKMKCFSCNGTGKVEVVGDSVIDVCDKCGGTGVVKPLTNEKWRRTCSTEEFAKWLSDTLYACMRCGMNCHIGYCPFNKCIIDKEDALAWLKEKHDGE